MARLFHPAGIQVVRIEAKTVILYKKLQRALALRMYVLCLFMLYFQVDLHMPGFSMLGGVGQGFLDDAQQVDLGPPGQGR